MDKPKSHTLESPTFVQWISVTPLEAMFARTPQRSRSVISMGLGTLFRRCVFEVYLGQDQN